MAESTALTERILVLRSLPFFSALPSSEVTSIARTMRPHLYAKGDIILREEEAPSCVHVVTSGVAGIWRKGHRFGALGPPEAIGFMPLVARSPDQFGVVAEAPTTTLEADADAVFELMEEQFELVLRSLRDTAGLLLAEFRRGARMPQPQRLSAPPELPSIAPEGPLDIVDRIFFLRKMRPFRRSSIDSLAVLSSGFEEVRLARGDVAWRTGDPSGTLILIATGQLRARIADGREDTIFNAGAVVGGFESMAGEPRWYDLTADTPVIALRGRTEAMLEIFEDNHDMARDFLAMSTGALMTLWDERIAAGDPPSETLLRFLNPQR